MRGVWGGGSDVRAWLGIREHPQGLQAPSPTTTKGVGAHGGMCGVVGAHKARHTPMPLPCAPSPGCITHLLPSKVGRPCPWCQMPHQTVFPRPPPHFPRPCVPIEAGHTLVPWLARPGWPWGTCFPAPWPAALQVDISRFSRLFGMVQGGDLGFSGVGNTIHSSEPPTHLVHTGLGACFQVWQLLSLFC